MQYAPRAGGIVHAGLTVETSDGKHYSVAYNALVGATGPGHLWCQEGKPPFKSFEANGDWPSENDHTWHSSSTKDGQWKSLADFRQDVESFASAHPFYDLGACDDHLGDTANCQLMASTLWKAVTGKHVSPCPGCEPSCFH